jgi:hypothetical protein
MASGWFQHYFSWSGMLLLKTESVWECGASMPSDSTGEDQGRECLKKLKPDYIIPWPQTSSGSHRSWNETPNPFPGGYSLQCLTLSTFAAALRTALPPTYYQVHSKCSSSCSSFPCRTFALTLPYTWNASLWLLQASFSTFQLNDSCSEAFTKHNLG